MGLVPSGRGSATIALVSKAHYFVRMMVLRGPKQIRGLEGGPPRAVMKARKLRAREVTSAGLKILHTFCRLIRKPAF
eukprot:6196715-Pleurochrysis_carterae.AAC.2